MLWAIIVLCCCIAGTQQIKITKIEVPTSVELGSNATLRCLIEKNNNSHFMMKWWKVPLESDHPVLIYQWIENQLPVAFHGAILGLEINSIMFNNVQPADSGIYECEASDFDEESRKRERLYVYSKGTGPNLTLSDTEDGPDDDNIEDVMILCTADDVTPEGELIIFIDNKQVEVEKYVVGSAHDGLFDYSVNLTMSKADIGEAAVKCELFYKNSVIAHPAFQDIQRLKKDESEDKSGDGVPSTTEAALDKSVDENSGGTRNTVFSMPSTLLLAVLLGYFCRNN